MTAAADLGTPPPRRKNGWLWLAKLSGALLFLGLIIVVVWYQSDGDLRAIRSEMAAAGFPTTSQDLGWQQSSPERRALRDRLDTLMGMPVFSGHANLPGNVPVPGVPLPAEVANLVASYPANLVQEMDDLLEHLGTEPVVVDPELTILSKTEGYQTIRVLRFRALVAAPADVLPLVQRLFAYAQRNRPVSDNDFWMRRHAIEALLQVLAYRRTALSDDTRSLWAQRVRSLTEDLAGQWSTAMRGQLVKELDLLAGSIDRVRKAGFAPNLFDYPFIGQLIMRSGRGPLLRRELAWAIFLQEHHGDLQAIRAEAYRRYVPTMSMPWMTRLTPSSWVGFLCSEPWRCYEIDHLCTQRLYAMVVAAALANEPMPVDLFDASGHVVRPLLEGGQVRGVYSVGTDGHDDGGDPKRDICWPLYEVTTSGTP